MMTAAIMVSGCVLIGVAAWVRRGCCSSRSTPAMPLPPAGYQPPREMCSVADVPVVSSVDEVGCRHHRRSPTDLPLPAPSSHLI